MNAALLVQAGATVALLAIHMAASGGTGTIRPSVHDAVSITPNTTLSRAYNHLIAGFFHTNWTHIAFNLLLFNAAFGLASRAGGPWATAGTAYVIGPTVVLLLHLLVVLPLGKLGWDYAAQALDFKLVGFSVMAYATVGMALAASSRTVQVVATLSVLAFELVAGLGRFTGPFIFVYHLAGFASGFLWRVLRVP